MIPRLIVISCAFSRGKVSVAARPYRIPNATAEATIDLSASEHLHAIRPSMAIDADEARALIVARTCD